MSSIDPGSARTAEDYVMLLRQARAMSELTYWDLEQRADAAGHRLEPAVLAETLGRAALPDEELVVALLRACGHDDEQIERWLSVRARLDSPELVDEPTVLSTVLSTVLPPAHPTTGSASRPRHLLRRPGQGARRAPTSRLRPLAITIAAVLAVAVIGIGSVAVIVSAINDGDDAGGPPVYAPGASPNTATAPQPTSTDTSSPAPTPSAGPTAPPSSAPPLPAGVLRIGTATLQTGQSLDLDGGGSDADIIVYDAGDSIRAGPSSRHFAPQPTASKQACASADYQKTVQGLTAGQGVCVRTDKGYFAHITVTRTAPLSFGYVVWS